MSARRVALLLLFFVVPASATPAAASSAASSQELRKLAERAAAGDDEASRALLMVDRVDGQPVDLRAALTGAGATERQARLRALASGLGAEGPSGGARRRAPEGAPGAASVRKAAQAILEQRRFQALDYPRPLRGVLVWVGERAQSVIEAVKGALASLIGRSASQAIGWILAAVLVLVLAVAVASRTVRRRALAQERGRAQERRVQRLEPDALEREAREASRLGDHDRAMRLLFQAGLLRLDRRGAIAWRPSLTSGEVARVLASTSFAGVAGRFDEVAYGGRPPDGADVDAARAGWSEVLAEAKGGPA